MPLVDCDQADLLPVQRQVTQFSVWQPVLKLVLLLAGSPLAAEAELLEVESSLVWAQE
jgi:hypothetical protein